MQRGPPGSIPAQEYSFRHILIQEAAYRAIPKSLRAELHHRFADWLEDVVSDPFPVRSEILGYHLERSVRYRNELWPADPQAAALSLRAAEHLETAGRAAHDRGDDVAAVNLLDRAAALLPGDDPALGRLYTNLGTALIEAGQFEKAKATLDHAQRITAANGDECQHAHARVRVLLLEFKVNPARPRSGHRPCASRLAPRLRPACDDLGICRALQLEGALHWNHSRSAAAEYAWQRAAGYARKVNDRRHWPTSSAGSPPPHSGARHPRRKGSSAVRTTSTRSETTPSGGPRSCLNLAGLHAMQDDFASGAGNAQHRE